MPSERKEEKKGGGPSLAKDRPAKTMTKKRSDSRMERKYKNDRGLDANYFHHIKPVQDDDNIRHTTSTLVYPQSTYTLSSAEEP